MSARCPTPSSADQNSPGVMFTDPDSSSRIAPARATAQTRTATSQVRDRKRKLTGPHRTDLTSRLTAAPASGPGPTR